MIDEQVYVVTELWVLPNIFTQLKIYRKKSNTLLTPFNPEYIFHNHAFEWIVSHDDEQLPSGIEIVKFENERVARAAIAALSIPELKAMEQEIFARIRVYISRHAFPDVLQQEIFSQ